MKRTLVRLGLATLVTSALVGCSGGGSDGVSAPGTTVTVTVPGSNQTGIGGYATAPTSAEVAAWKTLQPQIVVNSVDMSGDQPVVKFTVKDAAGNAVVGLGADKIKADTATVSGYSNLGFTLAKLVPAANGSPSKWVSYNVIKTPTVAQKAGTLGSGDSCTPDFVWCGVYPATDNQGTLVDNKDGTYQYTFYRKIKQVASIVATLKTSVDGLSRYEDLGDLTYSDALTHRLGIQISGNAPGTGTNTLRATQVIPAVPIAIPGNAVFDFVPNGSAVVNTRDIVDIDSCASCHNGKGLAHGFGRKDPRYCATCHTEQTKYSFSQEASSTNGGMTLTGTTTKTNAVVDGRALGNLPNLLHKIHMGEELTKQGYNYHPNATTGVGVKFNTMKFPQDPRNCTKCHSGAAPTDPNQAVQTKDGDNWKSAPSILACGSCHDGVNFAAGTITSSTGTTTSHAAGANATDKDCATCHKADSVAEYHRTAVSTANNPVVQEGIASISYDISSVKLNANKNLEIKFRIMKDGAAVTSLNVPSVTTNATTGVVSVSSTFQAIAGFTGGPSFYVAYAVPQDGIAAPADFNSYQNVSLTNLLVASGSPKAGTITGPVGDYFTATLTGNTVGQPVTATCAQGATTATGFCVNPSPIVVPADAKMVTGIILGGFTQKTFTGKNKDALTAKYPSGLVIKAPLKMKVADTFTGRRVIVDTNKCESCHEQLGTTPDFHGGARNDPTSCAVCHDPNRNSSGWSANASTFVHGIHAGDTTTNIGGAGPQYATGKRTEPFNWHRDATGFDPSKTVYPGILKKCENCHVANAVNYGLNGATLQPKLLWSTAATGKFNAATDTYKAISPYVKADNVKNYGNKFVFMPAGAVVSAYTKSDGTVVAAHVAGAGGETVPADGNTLVESPISSACFACHDSSIAKTHMGQYGGVIYGVRSAQSFTGTNETCLVCHGMGRDQDAAIVHSK
jgi:OmcA/MtrC family decaheme c-type cytochrome